MSGVNPGIYQIVNSVLTPQGAQLASNYVGSDTPLIVSQGPDIQTQRWNVIGDPGMPQTISLQLLPNFEAAPAGNFVEPLSAANYTWNIINEGGGYYIEEPNTKKVWAINKAAAGQQIALEPKGNPVPALQIWYFHVA